MTGYIEPSLALSAQGASTPGARRPHVLLLGGQDAPDAQQLLRRYARHSSADWPEHELRALAWPTYSRGAALVRADDAASPAGNTRARACRSWLPGRLDQLAAAGVTRAVAALDRRMHVVDGRARGLLSRAVYLFTRFSVDALYGPLGRELVELTLSALHGKPYSVIVAHSFGGTMALRAAWELTLRGLPAPRLEILALGTSSGCAVVRSPLWHGIPRDSAGCIALPPCVRSYRHFYSRSDAFVAAPALPKQFAGIELTEVQTGRFTQRGFGHALGDYLSAPAFRAALRAALLRAHAERPRADARLMAETQSA